jgi:hypothetical protein
MTSFFEDEAGSCANQSPDLSATFRALLERRFRDGLPTLKLQTAPLAFVFIRWHGSFSSLSALHLSSIFLWFRRLSSHPFQSGFLKNKRQKQ